MCLPPSRSISEMPRGPKGERRPADVIGNAVHVMRVTGEIEETIPDDGKDPAAMVLGRKGGKARAAKISKKQRSAIAIVYPGGPCLRSDHYFPHPLNRGVRSLEIRLITWS